MGIVDNFSKRQAQKTIHWENGDYKIVLNPYKRIGSRDYYEYKFFDNNKLIFSGNDFSPSPMDDTDEKKVVSFIGFLTLRKGDTDDEYFEGYTPEQLEWSESDRAEDLKMIQMDLEEKAWE